jgi:hypothetical protein
MRLTLWPWCLMSRGCLRTNLTQLPVVKNKLFPCAIQLSLLLSTALPPYLYYRQISSILIIPMTSFPNNDLLFDDRAVLTQLTGSQLTSSAKTANDCDCMGYTLPPRDEHANSHPVAPSSDQSR